jgi:hypothetical protein
MSNEAEAFARACQLVPPDARIRDWIARRAFAQAALELHRLALPGLGAQFGTTPAGLGIASIWHSGDAHAPIVTAETPALALLNATLENVARRAEDEARTRCTRCGGRGWFVRAKGGAEICPHG